MIIEVCGAQALPIVELISFLIGMIRAFVGNAQLANSGASIYVADLVGVAIVREMGVATMCSVVASITAIVIPGPTFASC